jgi:putative SOS response-associated peptidase YedK
MCGRYALCGPRHRSREEREFFESLESFAPRYNIAPTDVMPIAILKEGRPVLVPARWGLVTAESKDLKSGAKKINAPCQNVMKWPASLVEPLGEQGGE